MRSSIIRRSVLAALVPCALATFSTAQEQSEIPVAGSEVLDVSLYTVPFYAIDKSGRPVFDLRADEIELRVDGAARAVDSFDRWQTTPRGTSTSTIATEVERPPTRFVFLLFDQAFLSPRGLNQSQRIAGEVIENLGPQDRVFVLTNDVRHGFRQVVGPVNATKKGRRYAREWIDTLRPNVGQMNANLDGEFYDNLLDTGQLQTHIEAMAANARSEYREMAELFAESLATFAESVALIREPKLLLMFSDGVDSGLYFDGENGLRNGSDDSGAYHGQTRRAGPLRYRFEDALAKLAASGTVPGFVSGAGSEASGRSMLFHMGDASGGRLFENGSVEVMEKAILNATSAYYEAGFYPTSDLDGVGRVEVVVKRPGVETFGPNRVVSRRGYGDLDALGRRNMIVDLVYRGVAGQALGVPEAMPGKVRSREVETGRELLFRSELPTAIHGKALDLYEVTLAVDEGAQVPKVLRYDRKALTASSAPLELTTTVPDGGTILWGVVAVEAESGTAYYRRLELSNDS